jgi:hypothetical protein
MKILSDHSRMLSLFLLLVAIHSIVVGICLIVSPVSFIEFLGFPMKEKFYAVQGGVFHLVVSVAYLMAARDIRAGRSLVIYSFTAKFMATVFLFTYYFAVNPILLVLLSGIGDMVMGVVIYLLYRLVWHNRPEPAS